MSILFFDGFDRCTVTKSLDPNYWSLQQFSPVPIEEYSFGGYSYSHQGDYNQSNDNIFYEGRWYETYSPYGSPLPTGRYMPDQTNSSNGVYVSGNRYPGFGSPPGFLALPNIDISDSNNLRPISYIQLSGFNLPQGDSSFLTSRILGIETKDSSIEDIDGRFGTKHPLVAFCNGDNTGLLINVVKVSANHLTPIETQKVTIGLEIVQNNAVSGTFDLNITEDLAQYRVRPVYSSVAGYQSGDMGTRILTIDSDRDGDYYEWNPPISPISRWCHFQFGIIGTGVSIGEQPYLQIKLEDVDLLSIPDDDTITDKDFWDDRVYIDNFTYDNIRFFNRTYNNSIEFTNTSSIPLYFSEHRYYALGSLTLFDDIILSDNVGSTNTFLGKNAKIVPFSPGKNRDVNDNGTVEDGLLEWSTNTSSSRTALKNADGDDGIIYTSASGAITAVAYTSYNSHTLLPDTSSRNVWGNLQDAIGGIKFYNQSKKEFLDTSYQNVIRTGVNDIYYGDKTQTILYADAGTFLDRTRQKTWIDVNGGVQVINSPSIFGQQAIEFSPGSFLTTNYSNLRPSNNTNNPPNYPRLNDYFAIESWVYFTGQDPITLFSKRPPDDYDIFQDAFRCNFDIMCHTDRISYNTYLEDNLVSTIDLFFPEIIQEDSWYHVAFLRDAFDQDNSRVVSNINYYDHTYSLIAFLDGVSGTRHRVQSYDLGNISLYQRYYDDWTNRSRYTYYKPTGTLDNNDYVDYDKSAPIINLDTDYSFTHSLHGSGIFSDMVTGTIQNLTISTSTSNRIISFDSQYDGNIYYNLNPSFSNTNYPLLNIKKNSNSIPLTYYANPGQETNVFYADFYTIRPLSAYNTSSGIINVRSGDNISFYMRTDSSSNNIDLDIELYISSGIIDNSIFYLDNSYYTYLFNSNYMLEPRGIISHFADAYSNTSFVSQSPSNRFPLFVGGNNIISNYRITQGAITIDGQDRTVYDSNNFDVPTTGFLSKYDDYINIGNNISLTKTRYGKILSFYEYDNPSNSLPWTTGLIADPDGVIVGVKKT